MPTVLHADDFNRADSTGLGGAPFNWGTPSGGFCNVFSNAVSIDASSDSLTLSTVAIPGDDTAYAQCKISPVGGSVSSGPGVAMTKTDGQGYRLVTCEYTGSVHVELARFQPSYISIWQRNAGGWSNGDTLRMELIGNIIRAYRNGVQIGADQTLPAWTGTLKAGVTASSTFTSGTLDDWEMGIVTGDIDRPRGMPRKVNDEAPFLYRPWIR